MHTPFLITSCLAALLGAVSAAAADSRFAAVPKEQAVSTHGPYEAGACDTCHERANAKDPGRALKVTNDLCFDCHDDFKGSSAVKLEKMKHPSSSVSCTKCHNPHNSKKRKLLL
jgi:predicted CXXCH cytochrome family protein